MSNEYYDDFSKMSAQYGVSTGTGQEVDRYVAINVAALGL